MPLDSNGIWEYEEGEDAATMSDLLNRGMGSVSAALEQLLVSAGPTFVAADGSSAFTGGLTLERVGRQVDVVGSFSPVTNWGSANALQQPIAGGSGIGLPTIFVPGSSLVFTCPGAASTTNFRVAIQSNGGVQIRCDTASYTGVCNVNLGWKVPEV